MKSTHLIGSEPLTLAAVKEIINEGKSLVLSDEATAAIERSHLYLRDLLDNSDDPVYGINTGFGSLWNVKISRDNLSKLQENLVLSHACGTGNFVPQHVVRIMLLLKIQSLSYGFSGIQLKTVQRLIDFYNEDILPMVFTQGSLGASGDLAPLAHLALPLIGKGEVFVDGRTQPAAEVLQAKGWEPIVLEAKEGLALLNGTQFMSAYGVHCLIKGYKLAYLADLIGSLSLDAFDCNMSPFHPAVHRVRAHKGQVATAERIREFLDESQIGRSENKRLQDPYSFRCIPQVHGASRDMLDFVRATFETEINSVTDNPNIFVDENQVISGGNFHGQPLAIGLDSLAIAIAELGNISERRTFQLVSGLRGLPQFLVSNPGLNSGFMIPQYTAASIVSRNKQLCTPASVDSIVSSNGQEDHVSMGANAATQCAEVVDNLETILAIELMNASQALVFRKPKSCSPFLESFLEPYRWVVPFVDQDRLLADDIHATVDFLQQLSIDSELLFD